MTPPPTSLFDRLWPAAGTLLLLVALLGSVLWWRAAGPVQVKGERVVTSRTVRQPAPGEPPQLLALDRQLQPGDYAWNAVGVTGRPWIVVDLASRELHAFRGRTEVGRTAILHGRIEKPTPTGDFTITQKDADHISNIYHVPMPMMLRLTDDGIAIHASTIEFGENTHGCVGVPMEFAQRLFGEADLGTRVTIVDTAAVNSRGRFVVAPPA